MCVCSRPKKSQKSINMVTQKKTKQKSWLYHTGFLNCFFSSPSLLFLFYLIYLCDHGLMFSLKMMRKENGQDLISIVDDLCFIIINLNRFTYFTSNNFYHWLSYFLCVRTNDEGKWFTDSYIHSYTDTLLCYVHYLNYFMHDIIHIHTKCREILHSNHYF